MRKTLIFLLLFISICSAQEMYTYLIDLDIFSHGPYDVKDLANYGAGNITKAKGQPFRLTRLDFSENGKYAIVWITPQVIDERNVFKFLNDNKYITKLSSGNVVTKKNRFGEYQTWEGTTFNSIPKDYDVIESTPKGE